MLYFNSCMVVFRLAKEKVSYEQEAGKQQEKIDSMKAGGEDQYVIKKQVGNSARWLVD